MGQSKLLLRCTPIKHTECTNNRSMHKTSISLHRLTFRPILIQLRLSQTINSIFKQEMSKQEMPQHLELFITLVVMFQWQRTTPPNLTHTTGRTCFLNSDLARMSTLVPCTASFPTATHGRRCLSMWKTQHHNTIYRTHLRHPTTACSHSNRKYTTKLCTLPRTPLLMVTNSAFPFPFFFFDLYSG